MLAFLDKPGFLIVALVALVLFGAKRLPDSARSLGRSMRILKAETRGLHEDHQVPVAPIAVPQPVVTTSQPVVAAAQPVTAVPVTPAAPAVVELPGH